MDPLLFVPSTMMLAALHRAEADPVSQLPLQFCRRVLSHSWRSWRKFRNGNTHALVRRSRPLGRWQYSWMARDPPCFRLEQSRGRHWWPILESRISRSWRRHSSWHRRPEWQPQLPCNRVGRPIGIVLVPKYPKYGIWLSSNLPAVDSVYRMFLQWASHGEWLRTGSVCNIAGHCE